MTSGQKKGVRATIVVLMLVLALSVALLIAGHPIAYFGSKPASVAYAVVVYLPVMALGLLAYRRVRSS